MNWLGRILWYLFDRIFSAIILGLVLALIIAEMVRRDIL